MDPQDVTSLTSKDSKAAEAACHAVLRLMSEPKNCEESDQTIKTKLGLCQVCSKESAKFTCPKCEYKTCSLGCCNAHKTALKCSGVMDRTKFARQFALTEFNISRDYRLLEELSRVENRKMPPHGHLRSCLKTVAKVALRKRYRLKYLPSMFERHKKNSTYVDVVTKNIAWHVELGFMNVPKVFSEQVCETTKVGTLLDKYLNSEDKQICEMLRFYQSVGLSGIRVFLKAEQKKGRGSKFYELDYTCTLRESLGNKLIIEFPIIHVALKDHCTALTIIDSDADEDDDDDKPTRTFHKSGNQVIDEIIRSEEKLEGSNSKSKNYLILSSSESD